MDSTNYQKGCNDLSATVSFLLGHKIFKVSALRVGQNGGKERGGDRYREKREKGNSERVPKEAALRSKDFSER